MKKLFKNSFKVFMQSKFIMILLAILVFISSASFTMLNASGISFQTSYDTVMDEGNVHDFTIKPKWKIDGKPKLKLEKVPDIIKTFPRRNPTKLKHHLNFSNRSKEIFMDTTKLSWFTFNPKQTTEKTYKIDLSDANLSYKSTKFSDIKINGNIKLFLYTNFQEQFILSDANSASKETDINKWSTPIIINSKVQKGSKQIIKHKILKPFSVFGATKEILSEVIMTKSGAEIIAGIEQDIKHFFKKTNFYKYEINNKDSTGVYGKMFFDWTALIGESSYPIYSVYDNADDALLHDKNIKNIIQKTTEKIKKQLFFSMSSAYIDSIKNLRLKDNTSLMEYIYYPSNIESVIVTSKTEQFKVVLSQFGKESVDKTVIFKGGKPSNGYTKDEMKKGLDNLTIDWKNKIFSPTIEDDESQNFNWIRNAWFFGKKIDSIKFINFDALQAVVSPSYANINGLITMNNQDLQKFREDYLKGVLLTDLFNKYKKQGKVITVDYTDYLIKGIGTSPDFSFPIINHKNPLPNPKTQAIIFTSKLGYERIRDAFRNNETENYIAFKFKNNISKHTRDQVLKIIEEDAIKKMTWPKNISPLTMRNDISEQVILAPQRISFLEKIQSSISSVTYLTTSLLFVLVMFIIIIVVKKQIKSKIKTIGILLANGYSKHQISYSMMAIAFIVITIPSALGYLSGYFLQSLFTGIFNNYWTLPIVFSQFSFITMCLVIFAPMLITMLVAYLSTRLELKKNILNIINEYNSKTGDWLTSEIFIRFKNMSIKTKISISLFTSNIFKMIMISITTTIALLSGSVAFSIIGKFAYSEEVSSIPIKYSYKIDLETPTRHNNGYLLNDLSSYGLNGTTWDKTIDAKDMFRTNVRLESNDKSSFHWITNDFNKELEASKKLDYLKNKIQMRSLLDVDIMANINPWNIAKSSMPENQLNHSLKQDSLFNYESFKLFRNKKYKDLNWYKNLNGDNKKNVDTKIKNFQNKNWFKSIENNTNHMLKHPDMNNDFKNFIFFSLKTQILERLSGRKNYLPFMISYGNIVKEKDDEVYSQLSFEYNNNNNSKTISTSGRIIGLKNMSKMVKLSKKSETSLRNFANNESSNHIPIVINKYFQEAYGVNGGDIISIKITNHKNRNNFHFMQSNSLITAKVVGIEETYNGIKIYSLQNFVNDKLGYKKNSDIFNGIFTKQKHDPLILKGVSLYSESGFYIGTPIVDSKNNIWHKIFNKINDINSSVTDYQSYIVAYSSTPYVLSMSNASWTTMSEYAFASILDLTNKIIWMIETIVVLISIIFIVIISSMVVNDNKKFIATTKTLGYKNNEIKKMFFSSLIPSLLLSVIITVPCNFVTLIGVKYIIMSFGAILVPITFIWWAIPLSLVIIITIFLIIYKIIINRFGNKQMLEAFKI